MRCRLARRLVAVLITGMVGSNATIAAEEKNGHKLDFAARLIHFDVDFRGSTSNGTEGARSSYTQTALGLQLNYASPKYLDIIGVGASLYGVGKVDSGGRNEDTTQLLMVGSDGRLDDGYLALGQAFVSLSHGELASARIGRQLQNSLLLKSTTSRAVPDTYSGFSGQISPFKGVSVYGAVYDRWRPRSGDDFEEFKTDLASSATVRSHGGDIDYVGILGVSYVQGPFAVNFEYLNSKNYLHKTGLVGAYTIPLSGKDKLTLSGGFFTSRDGGDLFVCGAESEVDCGGVRRGARIHNDGKGAYLDADWKVSNFSLGAAVAKFDGLWIEDNFSVESARPNANGSAASITDHGTNPFPTAAAMGPDFASNKEFVWSVRLGYNWKDYIPGLSTGYKYSRGTGAKNSARESLGSGSEKYHEVDVRYAIPLVKGLGFRYLYMKYKTDKTGELNSITRNFGEVDHRVYLDYAYKF